MKSLRLISIYFITILSTQVSAALLTDQITFGPTTGVGGGLGTVGQSFQPSATNIAGIDLFVYSVAKFTGNNGEIDYTANLTLSLHAASSTEDFSAFSTPALVSANYFLDTNSSREGTAEFRWSPIAVTPDSYYAISLSTDNGVYGAASTNPYARGQVMEFGLGRDYFDLDMTTYYDDTFGVVPLPASVWLFGSALFGLIRLANSRFRFRR
ncbi:MAG: hypothetical protein ACU84Q_14570 [Gammaproteobacteria bacterium]